LHPWLLYTDTLRLPTYFTMLMVGFALATFVLRREALRDGAAPRQTMDAALWAVPAAIVGARAAHVLLEEPAFYWQHPWSAFSPAGGWVFYGGAVGGLLAIVAFARHRGLDAWALLDRFAVATPFGLVFGRLGCLGGGCCFGQPADFPLGRPVPWAIRYYHRGTLPDALLAVPVHAAPLYAIGLALLLFVGLSTWRARQRVAGEAFLAFLLFYGIGRSILEIFRADAERGVYLGGWLSTSQALGLASAVVAFVLWRIRVARCIRSSST